MKKVLMMSETDNVAIAITELVSGDMVTLPDGSSIAVQEEVPRSHKIAIRSIALNQPIIRYGEEIGYATKEIAQGQWVHVHNLDAYEIM